MGTRGALTFVVDGVEKTGYNHFDSYPSGLGKDVLEWLRHPAMRTQTSFYGPLEITHYGNGAADVFRCEVTIDGVTHKHVLRTDSRLR